MANLPTSVMSSVVSLNSAGHLQCGQALLIQAYAQSVQESRPVSFPNTAPLALYQLQIKAALQFAQTSAAHYLMVLQPELIQASTDICNFFTLNSPIATCPPEGASVQDWLEGLRILRLRALQYRAQAEQILYQLQTWQDSLPADLQAFIQITKQLNQVIQRGMLSQISTPDLESGERLMMQELTQAITERNIYQQLVDQSRNALAAIDAMEELWHYLTLDLGNMISHLDQGIQAATSNRFDKRSYQPSLLEAANMDLQDVIQDLKRINRQLCE